MLVKALVVAAVFSAASSQQSLETLWSQYKVIHGEHLAGVFTSTEALANAHKYALLAAETNKAMAFVCSDYSMSLKGNKI